MLAAKIRERMAEVGMKPKALAEKTGIPLSTINNIIYERIKDTTHNNVVAIAHALDCRVDDFTDSPVEPDTIAAHHDGMEYTSEELEEIEKFKEYVKSKRAKDSE